MKHWKNGMTFWLDAHLSPQLAPWIEEHFKIKCTAVRDLNLHFAQDQEIFEAAGKATVVVITCGNTSTAQMKKVFEKALLEAIALLKSGEPLVEISG